VERLTEPIETLKLWTPALTWLESTLRSSGWYAESWIPADSPAATAREHEQPCGHPRGQYETQPEK
jgi:hypothetical protein